jgi:hypothetical protein
MRPQRHPEPRTPFVLQDAQGRTWTILHTAERSYLAAASAFHVEITAEHARAKRGAAADAEKAARERLAAK